jgi:hypothetical protein
LSREGRGISLKLSRKNKLKDLERRRSGVSFYFTYKKIKFFCVGWWLAFFEVEGGGLYEREKRYICDF